MRTSFLIDGFNLYHSILEAPTQELRTLKWLDLHSLCKSYLPNLDKNARMEEVYYFSAYAKHLAKKKRGVVGRHKIYIKALESTGVQVILGQFKGKDMQCPKCNGRYRKHEEKETDVAIAIKLLELFQEDKADHIVLVTGDTDLIPAVKTANKLFQKDISILFPYNRSNEDYKKFTKKAIKIKADRYHSHQFKDPVVTKTGEISKPREW